MMTISYQNIKDSRDSLVAMCSPMRVALALANGTAKTLKRAKKKTLSLLTIAISQLVTMPFHVFVTISPELTTTLALAGSLAHWSRLANLVFVYTLFSKLVNIERS